jgi:site-specific recombinase XerD
VGFLTQYYPRVSKPNEVTRETVDDYQHYVRELTIAGDRPLANATVRLKLTAVKQFFAFLVDRDLVLKNPTSIIVAPKPVQRLVRTILTEREVLDLLKAIDPRDPASTRDRAILELFYACGMRTSELCNLKIADVDLSQQTATIINGKGGKSRIVPIGQYAAHFIQGYIEKARRRLLMGKREDPGNLFLSSNGTPFTRESINRSVMGRVNRILEGKKRVTCYSFRHSVATHMIANGVDIAYVAQLLGHSTLETTRRYLRIEIGDLKQMHALYHPREKARS